MPKIKICGITTEEELQWLIDEQVEYAGFVIWEKSKRYCSVEKAKELLKKVIAGGIKTVAVTVSPNLELVQEIETAGFDLLQVHGELDREVAEEAKLPIWRAINLNGWEELEEARQKIALETGYRKGVIEAVLADAKEYGSGRTFGWDSFRVGEEKLQQTYFEFRKELNEQQIAFILAGGLKKDNVKRGISIFKPDIVDVSSGVEKEAIGEMGLGKDRAKIKEFVQCVRREQRGKTA